MSLIIHHHLFQESHVVNMSPWMANGVFQQDRGRWYKSLHGEGWKFPDVKRLKKQSSSIALRCFFLLLCFLRRHHHHRRHRHHHNHHHHHHHHQQQQQSTARTTIISLNRKRALKHRVSTLHQQPYSTSDSLSHPSLLLFQSGSFFIKFLGDFIASPDPSQNNMWGISSEKSTANQKT